MPDAPEPTAKPHEAVQAWLVPLGVFLMIGVGFGGPLVFGIIVVISALADGSFFISSPTAMRIIGLWGIGVGVGQILLFYVAIRDRDRL